MSWMEVGEKIVSESKRSINKHLLLKEPTSGLEKLKIRATVARDGRRIFVIPIRCPPRVICWFKGTVRR
jgi:hypothetical protein